MARARAVSNSEGQRIGYMIHCPACGGGHFFNVEIPNAGGARWTFNGDFEKPTFSPSMHVFVCGGTGAPDYTICHSFVRDGRIQFLSDCPHALAGQTVDLPEV